MMSGRTEWSEWRLYQLLGFGCCALPAPSPLQRTVLSYLSLLPFLTGWRCLSAMLFSVLALTGQHLIERQKPRKILSKQLPVALPGYLSLSWPEPQAVVLSCEQVPKYPAHCTVEPREAHHILDVTSHCSLRMALPSLPAPHPAQGWGRTALSQPALGGRAEQLLLVSLPPLPVEKGTKHKVISHLRVIWGTALLES